MMEKQIQARVAFIQDILKESGAQGLIFGNSGGKDSALAGILCKKATPNVLGVMMPCSSQQNYGQDMEDARLLAEAFQIDALVVDLTQTKQALIEALNEAQDPGEKEDSLSQTAEKNIAPRLRMTTLYALAQTMNYLVVGTGNRSERFMGYFTKWGDGAFDLNPIADLTVEEIYQYLEYLKAPSSIIQKAPSAGLYPGQTDEKEMGITYAALDRYLLTGEGKQEEIDIYERAHRLTNHKRREAPLFTKDRRPE